MASTHTTWEKAATVMKVQLQTLLDLIMEHPVLQDMYPTGIALWYKKMWHGITVSLQAEDASAMMMTMRVAAESVISAFNATEYVAI